MAWAIAPPVVQLVLGGNAKGRAGHRTAQLAVFFLPQPVIRQQLQGRPRRQLSQQAKTGGHGLIGSIGPQNHGNPNHQRRASWAVRRRFSQHKPVVQPGEPSMGHRVRVLQVHKNLIHFP